MINFHEFREWERWWKEVIWSALASGGLWGTDTCPTQASSSQHGDLNYGVVTMDVNGSLPQIYIYIAKERD